VKLRATPGFGEGLAVNFSWEEEGKFASGKTFAGRPPHAEIEEL
jgi:hypothetical protein